MILVDSFAVQHVDGGGYFTAEYLGEPGPSCYRPNWEPDPLRLGYWQRERDVERLLEAFGGVPDPERVLWRIVLPSRLEHDYCGQTWKAAEQAEFQEIIVRKVRTPSCGCCGANPVGRGRPQRRIQEVEAGVWRCEKHVGRLPCCIEGCGKTWALRPGESYGTTCICGKHWRLAPRYMRDLCNRIRRKSRRRGWDERLARIYDRAFDRSVRAARSRLDGHLDIAEIERMFG